uniref:Putative transmembrane protein n=1 Tax=Lutzomyia longipalpis TaxID=7200 RepID=A0A7G3AZJ4_LUTLO
MSESGKLDVSDRMDTLSKSRPPYIGRIHTQKPIITYAGDVPLFRSLESNIAAAVPNDTSEWRRSYGRPIKNVRMESSFRQFETDSLDKYRKGEWSILEHPVLHIFVTECNDIEIYKSTVKEEIDLWLKTLQGYGITDWMILIVETLDMKKTKNILPRTTVLDKIRIDFGSKAGDRCISVLNPIKYEMKATESFRCLLQRIRHFMLTGYNRNITKYEELIRANREKRNHEGWSFVKYFLLQEELAFVLEMLGLYSEALIQYDELDALFSQFILNSVFGEKQKWLETFEKAINAFPGISINRKKMIAVRKKIENNTATLLDFRGYLFERQCVLLQAAGKPWEIAERLLPFLFGTIREVDALKLETLDGSMACWEFICALEVLKIYDEANETSDITKCFQYCAPIWDLAKDKLYELGKLCGLLPGKPLDPMRHFQKLYLELSELAISTYKHISRLRSARLVGLDLGNFYCTLNEPNKAVIFFTDLLRELKSENWNYLVSQTLLELASCYRKMDDITSYTKVCASISCCLDLEILVRTFYFDEFIKSLKMIDTAAEDYSTTCLALLDDHFKVLDLKLTNESPIIQDHFIVVQLKVSSNFPKEVICHKISLSFDLEGKVGPQVTTLQPVGLGVRLPMKLHLDYKQDGTLEIASVVCETKGKQPLRRSSSTRRKISATTRKDFTNCLSADNVIVKPGINVVELRAKATRIGMWMFEQLSIQINPLDFLSEKLPVKVNPFEVSTKPASAVLHFTNLIAGIEQPIKLIIPREQFEERTIQLEGICDLPGRRDDKPLEQKVTLQCPWSRSDIPISLYFVPAVIASCRLHSTGTRKFLQVVIKGIYDGNLLLSSAQMKCSTSGVEIVDVNPKSQNEIKIYKNLSVSYLWEIQIEPLKENKEIPVVQVNFSVQYAKEDTKDEKRNYSCTFDVTDYATLFKIQAKVEPLELCRVNTVYAGDVPLFRSLESNIAAAVPNDTSEWRRSYGRPIKNVRMESSFRQFETDSLDKYRKGEWSILEHPVLHIFVTECNDIEIYKSTVKEEIDLWLKTLQGYGITDWMILIVETLDMKKTKNILPRTTVLDKIRIDFGSKAGDRCISVLNPIKYEMKATESFRCLLQRIRHFMLTGYNRNITKYEELIRANREKRNHEGWSFVKYFLLQEELAFVLEMLGLYSEALIQYDELDALFSQFILNSVFGEKQKWLETFEKAINAFPGISINRKKMIAVRKKIENNTATLLDFRGYLFERQCVLLQAAGKPWEIAERLLPFLFGTIREVDALKLETLDGSMACWEFICALEVLKIYDEANETSDITKCFQYCAPIWDLAKDKLYELGKLCGLLPGCIPSSEQLHTVVLLSTGIGDAILEEEDAKSSPISSRDKRSHSPNRQPKKPPTDKLKEALGSNEAFQKLYLELSELAISTYKHISRLRSARLVGLDLGNFYCTLNEPNKAVIFFTDLLRELKSENWNYLVSQTLLELASCYRKMDDITSYTKVCASISCCLDLEILVRTFYFDEFIKSLKMIDTAAEDYSTTCLALLDDHFKVLDLKLTNESPIIQDHFIVVQLKVSSNFPKEVICHKISLSFDLEGKVGPQVTTLQPVGLGVRLPMKLHLDYKQDGTLEIASVVCETKGKQPLRRSSSTRRKISATTRKDFTNCLSADNVIVKPGINVVELRAKATRIGMWMFEQLSIQINPLDFLSEKLPVKVNPFEVSTKPASAVLHFTNLIAGIEQPIKLIISSGSFVFPSESSITMKCSRSLKLRLVEANKKEFQKELIVTLNNLKQFEERTIQLEGICDLPGRRDDKPLEQKVTLQCPWSRSDIPISLYFVPAVIASCRLHSTGTRKFLQVVIKGIYDGNLLLSSAQMKCSTSGVEIVDVNPKSQNEIKIYKNLSVSYLWEIQIEPLKENKEIPVVQVNFSVQYAKEDTKDEKRNYSCTFDVTDYATLFKIQAKVEPLELCRVNTVCMLND